jgi:hypothetical protein
MKTATFTFWTKIVPTELKGQWVAHCLDFDVMSQGNSPQHALKMLNEAMAISLSDDMMNGVDPHTRRVSDSEWDAFRELLSQAKPCSIDEAASKPGLKAIIMNCSMTMSFAVMKDASERLLPQAEPSLPKYDLMSSPYGMAA